MEARILSSCVLLSGCQLLRDQRETSNSIQMNMLSRQFSCSSKRFSFKQMATTTTGAQTCTSEKAFVKPSPSLETFKTEKLINLTHWELETISENYIQFGFLYAKKLTDDVITRLKSSLSAALYHFYTLNGRFVTEDMGDGICISLDLNRGDGVEFIHEHGYRNIKIDDLNQDEIPPIVYNFFPLDGAINYDAHFLPMFCVQVTELADGFFLSCAFNHCVGDAMSFVYFMQSWANICLEELSWDDDQDKVKSILVPGPPVNEKFILDKQNPKIKLPYKHPDEFIYKYNPPSNIKQKFFHFPSKKITELRDKANKECNSNGKITTFQAYFSMLWESVTRASCFQPEDKIIAQIAANEMRRLRPPLPKEYFGSTAVLIEIKDMTAGRLLNEKWLGAKLLNSAVLGHTDAVIRAEMKRWYAWPKITGPAGEGPNSFTVGGATRMNLYELDYGWGKPLLIRSGISNKYDNWAIVLGGREGLGSIELELILTSDKMDRLQQDEVFMNMVE